LFYDSSAVVTPPIAVASPPQAGNLAGYLEVQDSAFAALDRAIAYARTSATAAVTPSDGFPLPATWIPSPTSFDTTAFIRLIHSYKARFRAQMARDTVS